MKSFTHVARAPHPSGLTTLVNYTIHGAYNYETIYETEWSIYQKQLSVDYILCIGHCA